MLCSIAHIEKNIKEKKKKKILQSGIRQTHGEKKFDQAAALFDQFPLLWRQCLNLLIINQSICPPAFVEFVSPSSIVAWPYTRRLLNVLLGTPTTLTEHYK